ncbi:hypothetical protein PR048_026642 [Dryococelus australis]|uniref:Reverse transcriptase RNase H-like domain-containing protein n=1 Tax=Dryococelus australis TaxID=614101 RepID=A0ABQ9GLX0_9NEOP|nr:hypothetical protein PR048_026642 [Dryococelus australis]
MPVLKYYDVNKPAILSVDASQFGIDAVLLQEGHLIACASKSLTDTEQRYGQIEKEMLAIVFGAENFYKYIYNKQVVVETDHKPLHFVDCPARLQRMRLLLQRFSLSVICRLQIWFSNVHIRYLVPCIACRTSYNQTAVFADLEREMELQVCSVVLNSKVTDAKLLMLQQYTERDHKPHSLCRIISVGWPEKLQKVPPELKQYWMYREDLSYAYGLVLKGKLIVVPKGPFMLFIKDKKVHTKSTWNSFFDPEWHLISQLLLKIVRCVRNFRNLRIGNLSFHILSQIDLGRK